MKNEKGFTLLEMLLVLMIVLLIGTICSSFSIKMTEKMIVDHFFRQLKLDIQMAQMWAMEHQRGCFVSFSSSNRYQIYHQLDEILVEREFPEMVTLNQGSQLKTIRFSATGHANNFGTIVFQTPFGQKNLIIYIDKGRIRYVE